MADKKQYVINANEAGQVMISEDVIASIAYNSLAEIEGFAGLSARAKTEFPVLLNAKNWHRGLKISLTEKGNIIVEMNVMIQYPHSVIGVATTIQETVSNAISSTTGITPKRVHVNVCGILGQ